MAPVGEDANAPSSSSANAEAGGKVSAGSKSDLKALWPFIIISITYLLFTVTDGAGEVIEREAGCATGLGAVTHDGCRSFCATATSAGLDGADLIRRC